MQNGIRQTTIRRDAPQTSGPFPVRTSNFHYAAMRCAEDVARGLSVQHSVRMFAGRSAADEIADLRATRDSYYLLAAAHRSAGRKRERAERRTAVWADFRQDPARYTRSTVRAWARAIRRAVTR